MKHQKIALPVDAEKWKRLVALFHGELAGHQREPVRAVWNRFIAERMAANDPRLWDVLEEIRDVAITDALFGVSASK